MSAAPKDKHPLDDVRFNWRRDEIGRHHCEGHLVLKSEAVIDAGFASYPGAREQIEDAMRTELAARFYGDAPALLCEFQEQLARLECELRPVTIPMRMPDGRPTYRTERNPLAVKAEKALNDKDMPRREPK